MEVGVSRRFRKTGNTAYSQHQTTSQELRGRCKLERRSLSAHRASTTVPPWVRPASATSMRRRMANTTATPAAWSGNSNKPKKQHSSTIHRTQQFKLLRSKRIEDQFCFFRADGDRKKRAVGSSAFGSGSGGWGSNRRVREVGKHWPQRWLGRWPVVVAAGELSQS